MQELDTTAKICRGQQSPRFRLKWRKIGALFTNAIKWNAARNNLPILRNWRWGTQNPNFPPFAPETGLLVEIPELGKCDSFQEWPVRFTDAAIEEAKK